MPTSLLQIHVDLPDNPDMPLATVGVGYELRRWRADALAEHVMAWVPDFALRPEERDLDTGRVWEKMQRAYRATFGNGNDRGAPAEILLHAICREFFGSSTILHKVFFKTADNDTVKGFDGLHCVHNLSGGLELWLGEAKFYSDLKAALRAASGDLEQHLRAGYLKGEFAIVSSKISDEHPHAADLRDLMRPNRRIEDLFERIVLPVFVTYDSPATAHHGHVVPDYLVRLEVEAKEAAAAFRERLDLIKDRQRQTGDPHADLPVQVRLFLLPMDDKDALVDEIKRRLTSWLP